MHCPHCHKEATETSSFLLGDGVERYCNECGWNTQKVARNLQIDIWVLWACSAVGVLLTAKTWVTESWGPSMALSVGIVFLALPFGSSMVTKYRLSKIAVAHRNAPAPVSHETSAMARVDAPLPSNLSLAARPRAIRLTKLGYVYSVGTTLATALVLWVLSFGLRGLIGPRGTGSSMNGELSRGAVITQSNSQLGSRIVYRYTHGNGNAFQSRATDFSRRLCEEMPIHVFYNPLNSRESAVLEGSLFRFV